MKKILAVLLALVFMLAAVSCADNTDAETNVENNNGTEQTVTPEAPEEEAPETQIPETENPEATEPEVPEKPENDSLDENDDGSDNKLNAVSYDTFKEFIGYSMMPYDMKVNTEKNMVHAVAGYNGKVELSYFSFVTKDDAAKYFEEIAASFPGELVESVDDGDYQLCTFDDGEFGYMMARLYNTIIYGSSKEGIPAVNEWMYGLGYVTK